MKIQEVLCSTLFPWNPSRKKSRDELDQNCCISPFLAKPPFLFRRISHDWMESSIQEMRNLASDSVHVLDESILQKQQIRQVVTTEVHYDHMNHVRNRPHIDTYANQCPYIQKFNKHSKLFRSPRLRPRGAAAPTGPRQAARQLQSRACSTRCCTTTARPPGTAPTA